MTRPAAILFDLDGTLTGRRRTMAVFADGVTLRFADALRPPTDDTALCQHVFDALMARDADRRHHVARQPRDADHLRVVPEFREQSSDALAERGLAPPGR